MLQADIVRDSGELLQIHALNQQNLKQYLTAEQKESEGFLTWLYSPGLLQQMHELAPSIVVRDGDRMAGYALTTLPEARHFHPDLEQLFRHLEGVSYRDRLLSSYNFYCMGQVCVDKDYRGKGIIRLLYQKHRETYGPFYDFLLTEISTANHRSQRAHEKIGFETIYTYRDAMDEWNIIVWNWK